MSGAKRQQASKKEKNQKGVRGLLASMKDVFTPREDMRRSVRMSFGGNAINEG